MSPVIPGFDATTGTNGSAKFDDVQVKGFGETGNGFGVRGPPPEGGFVGGGGRRVVAGAVVMGTVVMADVVVGAVVPGVLVAGVVGGVVDGGEVLGAVVGEAVVGAALVGAATVVVVRRVRFGLKPAADERDSIDVIVRAVIAVMVTIAPKERRSKGNLVCMGPSRTCSNLGWNRTMDGKSGATDDP